MKRNLQLQFKQAVFLLVIAVVSTTADSNFTKIALRSEPNRILAASNLSFCESIDDSDVLSLNVSLADLAKLTQKARSGNELKSLIAGNTTITEYGKGLVFYAIPWIVLSITTLLIFIGFIVNALCCRCGQPERYTEAQKKCCIFPMAIFGVTVTISAIVVAVASVEGAEGIGKSVCVSQAAYIDFIYGNTANDVNWVGLAPFASSLHNISQEVFYSPQTLGVVFDDTAWMSEVPINQTSLLNKIYGTYGNSQLQSTNPNVTARPFTQITKADNFGPISAVGTFTGNLSLETNSTTSVGSKVIEGLRNVTKTVKNQSQVIYQNLKDTFGIVNNFSANMIDYKPQIDANSQEVYSQGNNLHKYALTFSIVIGTIVLFVLGVSVLIYWKDLAKLRFILHIFWVISILATLVCFILGALISPGSVVFIEVCDIISSALDQASPMLKTYGLQLNISDLNEIDVCINGNGSIADYYQISANLSILNQLNAQTKALQQYKDNITTYSKDPVAIINNTINCTLNYSIPADDGASIANLAIFNSWSSYNITNSKQLQTAGCNITLDLWVLDASMCPVGVPIFNSTTDPKEKLGSEICLIPFEISDSFVASRYEEAVFNTCQNANVTSQTGFDSLSKLLRSYHALFNVYQVEVKALLANIKTSVSTYQDTRDNFTLAMANIFKTFDNFSATVTEITGQIIGPKGLVQRVNCSFFGMNARKLYFSTCEMVAPNVFKLAVAIPIFGFCLLLFTFFTYCMTVRASRKTEGEDDAEPEDNVISKFEMTKF